MDRQAGAERRVVQTGGAGRWPAPPTSGGSATAGVAGTAGGGGSPEGKDCDCRVASRGAGGRVSVLLWLVALGALGRRSRRAGTPRCLRSVQVGWAARTARGAVASRGRVDLLGAASGFPARST